MSNVILECVIVLLPRFYVNTFKIVYVPQIGLYEVMCSHDQGQWNMTIENEVSP